MRRYMLTFMRMCPNALQECMAHDHDYMLRTWSSLLQTCKVLENISTRGTNRSCSILEHLSLGKSSTGQLWISIQRASTGSPTSMAAAMIMLASSIQKHVMVHIYYFRVESRSPLSPAEVALWHSLM